MLYITEIEFYSRANDVRRWLTLKRTHVTNRFNLQIRKPVLCTLFPAQTLRPCYYRLPSYVEALCKLPWDYECNTRASVAWVSRLKTQSTVMKLRAP
jgi:hypothetical protein